MKLDSIFRENPYLLEYSYNKLAMRKPQITAEFSREEVAESKERVKNSILPTAELPPASPVLTEKVENKKEGETLFTFESPKSLTPEELDALVHVDNINYRRGITYHKQNKSKTLWFYTITTLPIAKQQVAENSFLVNFQEFLEDYMPKPRKYQQVPQGFQKSKAILIFPKQDAHFDKFDIHGKNNIPSRLEQIEDVTAQFVLEAALFNTIEEVIYIVGSDQFNSEWTGLTTKGTPQTNALAYKESFEAICNHEVAIIDHFLENSKKVTVKFIPGNHDKYVGLNLILWLQAFYNYNKNVTFDTDIANSKTHHYSNTGILFNHGDELKPKDLAGKFPMIFRNTWSQCENFYVFTGDKHHEKTVEVDGITCYQVPAMSTAKSEWDDKKQFQSKGQMQAFLVKENQGVTNIYKKTLN